MTYRNSSIALSGGDLTVASGGSLTLDNVSLTISQDNPNKPVALSFGVIVQSGGKLAVSYSLIRSGNGSAYPAFLEVSGAGQMSHVEFQYLGGSSASPVSGKEGVDVQAAHVAFTSDVFDYTYEVLFTGRGAIGDSVRGSLWTNSTITGGQIGWVQVSGGASWTNLTRDGWYGASDAGMLGLVSGPHVSISNSTFFGDAAGTQWYQVYLTYDGPVDAGVDASYASLVDDRFQTANLGISDGAYYTIDRDWFNDTGHWGDTGGQAAIIVVTWIGSGTGQVTRHLDIENNVISNFTHYAIRVSQNVSGFNVSGNRIFGTESTYSNAITEADGIYLIRGVNNGTVWNNTIDMTDATQPSEPANGIVLEAQVNDVNVSDNRIYNCSEVGITVQGDSGALSAPAYFLGPSLRNVLYGNAIINFHNVSAQTMYSTEAIETWMWANTTRISHNYVRGWSEVDVKNYWNGAGLLTSSSDQQIDGNVFTDVRFGFVYEKFDGQQELKSLGSFNRSYNVMESNAVTAVGIDTIVENAVDDMGPVVNILSGPLDPGWSFWFSGANATLRIVGGELTALNSTSPYHAANIRFVGAVTLLTLGRTFYLHLSQWLGPTAEVNYGGFQAQLPVNSSGYDIRIDNYSARTDAVDWNLSLTANLSESFGFNKLVAGALYSFEVDGSLLKNLTAMNGSTSVGWNGSGNHSFRLVALTVLPPPTTLVASATGSPLSGTAPLTVQFNSTASGGVSPYAYQWRFGDGSTSSTSSPVHSYSAVGNYTASVTVNDSTGQSASASVTVAVRSPPPLPLNINAYARPTVGEVGLPVLFNASASGGVLPVNFTWNFGDNTPTRAGAWVSHAFASAGKFNVTLSAHDARGTYAYSSVWIKVRTHLTTYLAFGTNPILRGGTTIVAAVVDGGVGPWGFNWSGLDMPPSPTPNLTFTAAVTGSYILSVTVTDALGVEAQAAGWMVVLDSSSGPTPNHPAEFAWPAVATPLVLALSVLTIAAAAVGVRRSRRRKKSA